MTKSERQSHTCMIAGPQGSGVNSSSEVYARILTRLGYYVFSSIEYHSNIKGKHSHFNIRCSNDTIRSHTEAIDLLAVFDEESLWGDFYQFYPTHWGLLHRVRQGGTVIYDYESLGDPGERINRPDLNLIGIPYLELIDSALAAFGKSGEGKKYAIMKNAVALGTSLGLLRVDKNVMETAVRESFQAKKKAADMNAAVADAAYEYASNYYGHQVEPLFPSPGLTNQLLINGTQSVGISKIKAGCGFQSYYPISPATAESEYLEKHQSQYPMHIIQSEDEISAVNMAASAAHGGVRASTSTSGPGFALMAEGIGYGAITEAPGPVICLYQRAGPSTGIPTRQEQGDLRTSLHSAQGAYPMIALAPGDTAEYFYDTFEIFNLCERYQVPAVMLYDKHGARSMINTEPFDVSGMTVDHGPRYDAERDGWYQRYAFDPENPVTPRAIPGEEGGVFWTTSDEHQQDGHITEATGNRMAMMDKRMSKLDMILHDYPESKQVAVYGDPAAELAVVTWGTNKGVLTDILEHGDKPCPFRLLQVRLLNPFPVEALTNALAGANSIVCYEQNWQGELAGLIQENLLQKVHHRVLKFDGRPFSYEEALAGLQQALETSDERIVLSDGAVRNENSWGYQEVQKLVEERKQRPKQPKTSAPLPPGYNR